MKRAEELIQLLQLEPHPEGGAYRRVYRSELNVTAFDPPQQRAALTSIYYLLRQGEISCLHQISSEEAWHFYEGNPLELVVLAPDFSSCHMHRLGPVAMGQLPVVVVPANCWQAARSTGEHSLVGCSVAPGFEFDSFKMLRDEPSLVADCLRMQPTVATFIGQKQVLE